MSTKLKMEMAERKNEKGDQRHLWTHMQTKALEMAKPGLGSWYQCYSVHMFTYKPFGLFGTLDIKQQLNMDCNVQKLVLCIK